MKAEAVYRIIVGGAPCPTSPGLGPYQAEVV